MGPIRGVKLQTTSWNVTLEEQKLSWFQHMQTIRMRSKPSRKTIFTLLDTGPMLVACIQGGMHCASALYKMFSPHEHIP